MPHTATPRKPCSDDQDTHKFLGIRAPDHVQGHTALQAEWARVRAGAAMEKLAFGNTMAPEPPQAQLNNVPAWRASHENACAQLEHQHNWCVPSWYPSLAAYQHNWCVRSRYPSLAASARLGTPRSGRAFSAVHQGILSVSHACPGRGDVSGACVVRLRPHSCHLKGCGDLAAVRCGGVKAWLLPAIPLPSCEDPGLYDGAQACTCSLRCVPMPLPVRLRMKVDRPAHTTTSIFTALSSLPVSSTGLALSQHLHFCPRNLAGLNPPLPC